LYHTPRDGVSILHNILETRQSIPKEPLAIINTRLSLDSVRTN